MGLALLMPVHSQTAYGPRHGRSFSTLKNPHHHNHHHHQTANFVPINVELQPIIEEVPDITQQTITDNYINYNEELESVVQSISGTLTENDLQDLLLAYAQSAQNDNVNSGKVESDTREKSNSSQDTSSEWKLTLKLLWIKYAFYMVNKLEVMQSKTYEYFWISVLYLNFWFPRMATFLTYVSFVLLFCSSIVFPFTN
ncbi:hypothetical protein NCAS_0D01120 [Naumovozyma castellii]|uniref:Uncharacterized protein n=1 Tax=Naumovozyma castellii TaxID=27288 RepID=G0VDQ4_NAUCA|nr:hypothetical protein NCAS_0D01120 [Naumovozyma castellii CBS 4309]CCC69693.1 hypothetical protein NCAS_0D01120 [Naumovozyma castellii CBS 4309]